MYPKHQDYKIVLSKMYPKHQDYKIVLSKMYPKHQEMASKGKQPCYVYKHAQ